MAKLPTAKELLRTKHEEVVERAKERGVEESTFEEMRVKLLSHISKRKLRKILKGRYYE